MKNIMFFNFFLLILIFLYSKIFIKKLLSYHNNNDNLEECIKMNRSFSGDSSLFSGVSTKENTILSTFSKKQCSKKYNSKFSVYIKFNNHPLSPITVSTYVETFSYYTKNNTIMTPYYEHIDCLDNQYFDIFDINCFTKIDLVRNNKYDYIWLKFEKKDKTPFVNTVDFYIYDMHNVFSFEHRYPENREESVFSKENSEKPTLSFRFISLFDNTKFKNVIFVNGKYVLYNFYLNITNNNYPRFISKNSTNISSYS
jgi:hypothetical protein